MPLPFSRPLSPTERFWLWVAGIHIAGTLFVGYMLMPFYVTMDGPGPTRFWAAVAPIVKALMWLFYFPFVMELDRIGVISAVFPKPWYVIANSLFVSGVITLIFHLGRRVRERAA